MADAFGRVDVLVSNAGGAPYAAAAEASPRFHARIVELNLSRPCTSAERERGHAAQPERRVDRHGGERQRVRPSPGTAAYGAAKAGLQS